ncbi:NDP-hexose 2,3-dehydratase family protein [Streptomyces sp. NPDC021622]|uniref:NDP-hexose 2,3-dehydratase family protein n=1 Tax=Streptomyces sp. NPDC021622 TaxID=3155013 RepID=UPI0033EE2DE7
MQSLQISGPRLVRRIDHTLAGRLALSTASPGTMLPTGEFAHWLGGRRAAHAFRTERIPFAALDAWTFQEGTGNLVHRSGRFFSVEGLHVTVTGDAGTEQWHQPIIRQPEVGILGILAKEFDGVLHFLMQAKMEPGNPNLLQLSPTVQATRSNYTKVHQGSDVRYLEYFTQPDRGRVLTDVLQSEHGSWFYRKSNRNVIVEAIGDVPDHEDFCWLSLGQLNELLRWDNVVNMDSRTVLACIPGGAGAESSALHPDADLMSWFCSERSRHVVTAERGALRDVPGWECSKWAISHAEQRFFRVVALSVEAGNREVARWTQPLFEPVDTGEIAFVARRFDGVLHVLVAARVEGGFLDTVELGPTVQCIPGNVAHLPEEQRPAFLGTVVTATASDVLYEAVHSEEGGRFLNAESRYRVVLADETQAPTDPPAGFHWVTPDQLASLVQHGHYLNVQARTLLACLRTIAPTA